MKKFDIRDLLHGGGYANTDTPSQSAFAAASMAGMMSLMTALVRREAIKDTIERISPTYEVVTASGITGLPKGDDESILWNAIRSECLELVAYYERVEASLRNGATEMIIDYVPDLGRISHFAGAFARGDRFIVAKLAYDGGAA
ncbi:hypothetical protein [Neorhizobium sp. T7_12]|uniref:hypothetical protein n=1 Tax=Neorhizobium sp. T7_12 TaxID=2093832 RepID=UPI000CF984CB|nr:hypothetical protein [Neorhizobium sp. T7_12]